MKNTGKPPRKPSSGRSEGRPSRDDARKDRPAARGGARPFAKRDDKRDDRRSDKPAGDRPARKAAPSRKTFGDKPAFRGKPERSARPERSERQERSERTARPERSERSERPARDSRDRKPPAKAPLRDMKTRAIQARESRDREPKAREPKISLGPRANLFGLHAVREAWLNPKRSVHAIYLSEQAAEQFAPVLEQGERKGLERPTPKILSKDDFERLLGRDAVHQGAAMSAAPIEEAFVQDLISIGRDRERSVILMLDQVTDPHNVGAILRSACAFGADGVILQRRHAPELEGIVAKTASGAAEHIAVAYETNLSRALEELKEAGYTVIGLDEHAEQTLSFVTVPGKVVFILGAEGDGMRRLIREHCDVLVTLPTRAPIASLNVSNAAAVALYSLLQ